MLLLEWLNELRVFTFFRRYAEAKRRKKQLEREARAGELRAKAECVKNRANALLAAVSAIPAYDGYVEYAGMEIREDSETGLTKKYDHVNAKMTAELLMHERIRHKYGNTEVTVHTLDLPRDANSVWAVMDETGNTMKIRRLHYKAHPKAEKCEMCGKLGNITL